MCLAVRVLDADNKPVVHLPDDHHRPLTVDVTVIQELKTKLCKVDSEGKFKALTNVNERTDLRDVSNYLQLSRNNMIIYLGCRYSTYAVALYLTRRVTKN